MHPGGTGVNAAHRGEDQVKVKVGESGWPSGGSCGGLETELFSNSGLPQAKELSELGSGTPGRLRKTLVMWQLL